MELTVKSDATTMISYADMYQDFPRRKYSTQFSPKLFDFRNNYFTEQLCRSVWEELLMGKVYNGKTFKTKQKNP